MNLQSEQGRMKSDQGGEEKEIAFISFSTLEKTIRAEELLCWTGFTVTIGGYLASDTMCICLNPFFL